jgi:hypothetical protein
LKLPEQGAVRVGQPAQVSFHRFRRADTLEQFQRRCWASERTAAG